MLSRIPIGLLHNKGLVQSQTNRTVAFKMIQLKQSIIFTLDFIARAPKNEEERYVSKMVIHPQYFPPSYKNDLALLKLNRPVSFSPTVIPICIPDNVKYLAGEVGWVTGWGSNYGKNFANTYV